MPAVADETVVVEGTESAVVRWLAVTGSDCYCSVATTQ